MIGPSEAGSEHVGVRLRRLRLSRQLTQRELAELARVSKEAVYAIERGRKQPRRSTVSLLAEALGVRRTQLTEGARA